MSAFRDAARAVLEADLVCRCGAENVKGRPSVIKLEEGTDDRVGCTVCGCYGPLVKFQRPTPPRAT